MSAHADCRRATPKRHARQANVLRGHDVTRLQALRDGKIRRVGSNANGKRLHPEAPVGLHRRARVVGAHVPFKILRGVSRDDHGHVRLSCQRKGIARDRAGISIDEQGGHEPSHSERRLRVVIEYPVLEYHATQLNLRAKRPGAPAPAKAIPAPLRQVCLPR